MPGATASSLAARAAINVTVGAAAAAAHAFIEPLIRMSSARIAVAVVYHRLADEPAPRGRFVVRPLQGARFDRDIAFLKRRYRLVLASELADAAESRTRGQRIPLAVTFDDDSESYHRLARPVLRRRAACATFFLTGASLGGRNPTWWELLDEEATAAEVDVPHLARLLGMNVEPVPTTLSSLAAWIRTLSPERRRQIDRALALRGGTCGETGLEAGAVADLAHDGHEIGFHTRHHFSLATLDESELSDALTEGRAALERVVGRRCTSIAYPYGAADSSVARAAEAAGFSAGYTLSQRAVTPTDDRLLLGRVQPSYISTSVLAGRLAVALLRTALRGSTRQLRSRSTAE